LKFIAPNQGFEIANHGECIGYKVSIVSELSNDSQQYAFSVSGADDNIPKLREKLACELLCC
jgi:hypothetical protein